eukprot:gene38113-43643_t
MAAVAALLCAAAPPAARPKGVLFIAVDDMRPSVGAYNLSLAHTPNIDRLAAGGLLFTRAYVQYALCGPSRNSFMSGRRPDTTRVWNFIDHFRQPDVGAGWLSMPEYFKTHGFLTMGSGKSRFQFQLEDQRIRDSCAANLEVAAEAAVPGGEAAKGFFVACGFHKPHVPWVIPREFLDFYPKELGDIPLAGDTHAPVGMPDAAWHYPYDVRGFDIQFNGTCNETRSRDFRRGYYAAVAVRIPLIIRAPWKTGASGKVTAVLAEAVDFYPTLAALVGLPSPQSHGEEINGTSLEPVFDDPELSLPATRGLKTAAFSQLAKPSLRNPFQIGAPGGGPARNATEIMGYTFDTKAIVPITTSGGIIGRELYDHRGDAGLRDWHGEHVNVVGDAGNAAVVAELHAQILGYIRLFPVNGA